MDIDATAYNGQKEAISSFEIDMEDHSVDLEFQEQCPICLGVLYDDEANDVGLEPNGAGSAAASSSSTALENGSGSSSGASHTRATSTGSVDTDRSTISDVFCVSNASGDNEQRMHASCATLTGRAPSVKKCARRDACKKLAGIKQRICSHSACKYKNVVAGFQPWAIVQCESSCRSVHWQCVEGSDRHFVWNNDPTDPRYYCTDHRSLAKDSNALVPLPDLKTLLKKLRTLLTPSKSDVPSQRMVPKIRPTTEQFYLEQLKEIIAAKIEQFEDLQLYHQRLETVRLDSPAEEHVVFVLGHNGVGKSSTIDRLLHVTSVSAATYASAPPNNSSGGKYRLRGLMHSKRAQRRPGGVQFSMITRARAASSSLSAAAAAGSADVAPMDVDAPAPAHPASVPISESKTSAGVIDVVRMSADEKERYTGPSFRNKERVNYDEVLRKFADTKDIPVERFSSFILPCAKMVASSTTTMAIALHYDHRVHAVVKYRDEASVKQTAFTIVAASERVRNGEQKRNDVEIKLICDCWSAITGMSPVETTRLLTKGDKLPKHVDEIIIQPALLNKLGRCEIFAGDSIDLTGEALDGVTADLTADRFFVRDKLAALMQNRALRFVIDRADLYVPSTILHGISLLDGPGGNDIDAFNQEAMRDCCREADSVLIILNRGLSEDQASVELLSEVKFWSKLLADGSDSSLLCANVPEVRFRRSIADLRNTDDLQNVTSIGNAAEKMIMGQVKEQLLDCANEDSQDNPLLESLDPAVLSRISVVTVYPTLFVSLLARQDLSRSERARFLEFTHGYELLRWLIHLGTRSKIRDFQALVNSKEELVTDLLSFTSHKVEELQKGAQDVSQDLQKQREQLSKRARQVDVDKLLDMTAGPKKAQLYPECKLAMQAKQQRLQTLFPAAELKLPAVKRLSHVELAASDLFRTRADTIYQPHLLALSQQCKSAVKKSLDAWTNQSVTTRTKSCAQLLQQLNPVAASKSGFQLKAILLGVLLVPLPPFDFKTLILPPLSEMMEKIVIDCFSAELTAVFGPELSASRTFQNLMEQSKANLRHEVAQAMNRWYSTSQAVGLTPHQLSQMYRSTVLNVAKRIVPSEYSSWTKLDTTSNVTHAVERFAESVPNAVFLQFYDEVHLRIRLQSKEALRTLLLPPEARKKTRLSQLDIEIQSFLEKASTIHKSLLRSSPEAKSAVGHVADPMEPLTQLSAFHQDILDWKSNAQEFINQKHAESQAGAMTAARILLEPYERDSMLNVDVFEAGQQETADSKETNSIFSSIVAAFNQTPNHSVAFRSVIQKLKCRMQSVTDLSEAMKAMANWKQAAVLGPADLHQRLAVVNRRVEMLAPKDEAPPSPNSTHDSMFASLADQLREVLKARRFRVGDKSRMEAEVRRQICSYLQKRYDNEPGRQQLSAVLHKPANAIASFISAFNDPATAGHPLVLLALSDILKIRICVFKAEVSSTHAMIYSAGVSEEAPVIYLGYAQSRGRPRAFYSLRDKAAHSSSVQGSVSSKTNPYPTRQSARSTAAQPAGGLPSIAESTAHLVKVGAFISAVESETPSSSKRKQVSASISPHEHDSASHKARRLLMHASPGASTATETANPAAAVGALAPGSKRELPDADKSNDQLANRPRR